MTCKNSKTKNSPRVSDLLKYKDLYKESEEERKILSKDYTDLVKKCNVIEQENANLRKENERLRCIANGRTSKS